MFREITLGQYYPVDSVLHRLDPRTKLMGTLIYIVALFVSSSWVGYVLAILGLCGLIALSKVPVGYMFRGLRAIYILLLISVLCNLLLTQGDIVWQFAFIKITSQGLDMAVKMAVRLVCLVMGTSLMTLTTTPNNLTDGLEKGLGILGKVGVPVHEIAMMMSIALRFIPILVEETDKIMKAQAARGADFESGGLITKAKAMVPLLIPLFVTAFRRAGDLATAMEARCYHGGEGRTKMKPLKYGPNDRTAYICMLLYLAVSIAIRVFFKG